MSERSLELHVKLKTATNAEEIRMLAREYSKALGVPNPSLDDSEVITTAGAFGAISSLLAEQNARVIELEAQLKK